MLLREREKDTDKKQKGDCILKPVEFKPFKRDRKKIQSIWNLWQLFSSNWEYKKVH